MASKESLLRQRDQIKAKLENARGENAHLLTKEQRSALVRQSYRLSKLIFQMH